MKPHYDFSRGVRGPALEAARSVADERRRLASKRDLAEFKTSLIRWFAALLVVQTALLFVLLKLFR